MQEIMRFTSCQATDMDWWFWLSLLLTHLPVTENMGTARCTLTQPENDVWKKTGENALLPCDVSSTCSFLKCEWFVFKQNSHDRVNLGNANKYSLKETALHIHSLDANDSGIYHCAVIWNVKQLSGNQNIGTGTRLTVIGEIKTLERHILWSSFVLLVIYNMAVVTLIILKKHDCKMNFSRKMCKSDKNHSSKKTQFRDVLQEMNNRRNLKRGKQTAKGNRSQVENESTELNSSTDDVYQNV